MKKETKLAIIAASAIALPVFLTAPGHASKKQKAPFLGRNYAHRGLHSEDKTIPENSLEAFRLAAERGYGVELDVQLSKDGRVVVFHDDRLERVCGVNAAVNELTLEELQKLSLCGTEQTIPLFTEVLDTIDGRGPIICELKTCKKYRELCRKTYAILKGYGGDVCIESFDPRIVAWFRFHGREYVRGQLSMGMSGFENAIPDFASFFLSRCLGNFLARPQFIAYDVSSKTPLLVRLQYLLGAMNVGWTAHDGKEEKGRDALIFEFYRPIRRYR